MPEVWVMRVWDDSLGPHEVYLRDADVDARGGLGSIQLTTDQQQAKTFPSFADVFECWRTQSTIRPLRDDGKPNRPVTAFTISPERIR